jgi:hypothetical protein
MVLFLAMGSTILLLSILFPIRLPIHRTTRPFLGVSFVEK